MANFAFAVPSASIAAISSSFSTESPRETCQPTISILSFERKTRARRFRIDPDVVFGRRRHIALAAGRAAHDDAAADPLRELRIALKRQRDIGERPERHQREAGLLVCKAQDRVDGVFALGLALRRREAPIAKAVAPVEPMRVIMRAGERLVRRRRRRERRSCRSRRSAARFGSPAQGRHCRRPSSGRARGRSGSASAMMIATASSEAVSVSMRKLRIGPLPNRCVTWVTASFEKMCLGTYV